MTIHVNVAKAKAKLSELMARAEAGEEVVLTRNGKPVLKLAPIETSPPPKRVLGQYAHLGKMEDPYLFLRPDPELEAWMDAAIYPPE
jgi:prevent-host-death family protein